MTSPISAVMKCRQHSGTVKAHWFPVKGLCLINDSISMGQVADVIHAPFPAAEPGCDWGINLLLSPVSSEME